MNPPNPAQSSLKSGINTIKQHAKALPNTPGVYRMIATDGTVLYVGKAKALKKRVTSYTNPARLSIRIQRMVAQTHTMEFIHTHTEAEALLLETNLIKKLKPKFNILLRDDKSFPYILITGDHDFPLVVRHRGAKKRKGEYFGPFASAGAVHNTINLLQRAFLIRNCSDHVFANRTRPCLQYHIKRCTAPCVDLVDKHNYAEQVDQARDFLNGKSRTVQDRLSQKMQTASAAQDYETAALYRDRIKILTSIQAHQDINVEGLAHADVIALTVDKGQACVQVFFFRGGRNYGNRAYFPRHHDDDAPAAILSAFIAQFYAARPIPKEIIMSHPLQDQAVLTEALSDKAETRINLICPQRGKKRHVVDFALKNAEQALLRKLSQQISVQRQLKAVQVLFDLPDTPERIEVYDNSHISGTHMVGAMIVAGPDGFLKNAYRKFNIKHAGAGDDYAMMREVLTRRFQRGIKDLAEGSREDWPDLVIIDGGPGQLSAARDVFDELQITDDVKLVAIAKGEDRNAGRETFYMTGRTPFTLPLNDPTLHYLQKLRDESHRFAIGSHRARRAKALKSSPLDSLPGIGPKRKAALLKHFGSGKAVTHAGVLDLAVVDGISSQMAQKIYDYFHDDST